MIYFSLEQGDVKTELVQADKGRDVEAGSIQKISARCAVSQADQLAALFGGTAYPAS